MTNSPSLNKKLETNLETDIFAEEDAWLLQDANYTPRGGTLCDDDAEDDEELNSWLEGAVRKVDFRTRSSLSRKLDKKRQKQERNGNNELSKIEEMDNESERSRERTKKESNSSLENQKINNIQIKPEENDDNEEFFDASAEEVEILRRDRAPHSMHTSLRAVNANLSSSVYETPKNTFNTNTTPRQPKNGKNGEKKISNSKQNMRQASIPNLSQISKNYNDNNNVSLKEYVLEKQSEFLNLSDIERLAKEQEQELRMELLSHRERLHTANSETNSSRPTSSCSNASSINNTGQPLATSRSVDFRSHLNGHNLTPGATQYAHPNNSNYYMNGFDNNRMLNSRLPLPRRPTVPGRTNIPQPMSKIIPRTPNYENRMGRSNFSVQSFAFDDDDCF